MSSHGRAWRIRIGNSVNSRQREGPCRCGFLFFTRFYEGALGGERSLSIFDPAIDFGHDEKGPVAQLDRASHYGCEGLGFESLQGHREARLQMQSGFSFVLSHCFSITQYRVSQFGVREPSRVSSFRVHFD